MPTTLTSPTPAVTASVDNMIARITLNRPRQRNALNLDMWRALAALVPSLEKQGDIRVIVVSGAGEEAFSAGADIAEFKQARDTTEAARAYDKVTEAACAALRECPIPSLAAIRGYCIGGGLAIAASCDLRIAADDARFAIPAARLGLAYPLENLGHITSLVGPAVAKDLLFTARHMRAQEALAAGLVNQVVPAGQLAAKAVDVSRAIAENAPFSIKAAKATIDAIALGRPGKAAAAFRELSALCYDSEDYVEGRAAFLQKRRPVFKGQ